MIKLGHWFVIYSIGFLIALSICCAPESKSRIGSDGISYTWIPTGTFQMGCVPVDTSCWEEELPRHIVSIHEGFWMSQTEVTIGAFRKFVKESGYVPESSRENKGRMYRNEADDWIWTTGLNWEYPMDSSTQADDRLPVTQVSWADAAAYCQWAGGRLPTEAEWEYAARGGLHDKIFPWGDEPVPLKNGVQQSNAPDEFTKKVYPKMKTFTNYSDGYATTSPVGSFAPNGFSLYDMSGNVWEWTNDTFYFNAYDYPEGVTPPDSLRRRSKIVRGGAWCYSPEQHRCSERGAFEEEKFWTASLGFRCVMDK
jgi:formylglycine-generating enzyme required for sulfatase activity